MFVDFEEAFFPSEEKQRLWEATLKKAMDDAIASRECWMCVHTYLEPWNNHGHEDHVRMCKYSHQCVDFDNGADCPHWGPRDSQI